MSNRKTLENRLARKKTQLEIAYTAYDALLADNNESYRLDTGDGSQATKKRDIEKLSAEIDKLESEIDSITRKLKGYGLTTFTLNRRR